MLSVHNPRLTTIARLMFVLYLLVLIYILFLMDARAAAFHNINYKPFQTIRMFFEYYFTHHYFSFKAWFCNIFGNILLLAPFGLLLPIVIGRKLSYPKTALLSVLFSLLIECLQYWTRLGGADIDDLILNLVGALLGYAIYRGWHRKSRI